MSTHTSRPPARRSLWGAALLMWVGVLLATTGCEPEDGMGEQGNYDDPPSEPAHTDSEDGFMHAEGKDTPFLCGDGDGRHIACPDDIRPEPRNLSCDASGCHGAYEYDPSQPQDARDLRGSDGPSCYTCHGTEWSSRKD